MANDKEHGEGNYKATRDYNERTKRFVESGKVDEAAHEAAPHNPQEASEMEQAEQVGRSHAKEEDPALVKGRKDRGQQNRQ
ncbi:MAG TPA: hypothetical protein VFC24_00850 [Casimicrobiaceae bacterium]|nr:hypothetical protein [Casimicrobiaceae bacterium]